MATKYVNKNGSDSNSGDSEALAYLTIRKALESGVSDVYVGSGTYLEVGGYNRGASSMAFYADGRVIVDLTNGGFFFTTSTGTISFTAKGVDPATGAGDPEGVWIFRNAAFQVLNCTGGTKRFLYCVFEPTCLQVTSSGGTTYSWSAVHRHCEFLEQQAIVNRNKSGQDKEFWHCSFVNVTHILSGDEFAATEKLNVFLGNLVYNVSALYYCGSLTGSLAYGSGVDLRENYWYGLTSFAYWSSAEQTTLASLISGGTYFQADDNTGTDPQIAQSDRSAMLKTTSPVFNLTLTYASQVGCWKRAFPVSADYQASGAWDFSASGFTLESGGTALVGEGLSGPGLYTSPVYDLGGYSIVKRIWAVIEEAFPEYVLDEDTDDTPINRANVLYRYSVTSSADCEAQSFAEIEIGTTLDIVARWIQVRLRNRSDGV